MHIFNKKFLKSIIISIFVFFLIIPGLTLAHEPRIPLGNQNIVIDPTVSKAYYSGLQGNPHTYSIFSDIPFALYINILAPYISGQKKDISVKIIQNGNTEKPFAILDGTMFEWTKLFEPFGYDTYWKGPEYKGNVGSGRYDIIVSSMNNDSRYSLAIGETENFDFKEIVNALNLVPKIKRDFFDESPISFIFSPFGWGYILFIFFISFSFAFFYRYLVRKFSKHISSKPRKNIGKVDRMIFGVLGIIILFIILLTSWSPILISISFLILSDAIFR